MVEHEAEAEAPDIRRSDCNAGWAVPARPESPPGMAELRPDGFPGTKKLAVEFPPPFQFRFQAAVAVSFSERALGAGGGWRGCPVRRAPSLRQEWQSYEGASGAEVGG